MKFIAFDHEYDISNLPIDSTGVVNDLVMSLESEGLNLHASQLRNLLYFAPNVNSVRRVKKRENGDVFRKCGEGSFEIAVAAPDCNLYLALASLL